MFCPKCGAKLAEGAEFCGFCGEQMEKILCPSCGKALDYTTRFCSGCGKPMENLKCPQCGKESAKSVVYCRYCGASLKEERSRRCPNCGRKLEEDEGFCPSCGAKYVDKKVTPKRKRRAAPIIAAAILGLCVIAGAVFLGYRETSYKSVVSEAGECLEMGEFESAIWYLKKAVKLKPNVPENYLSLAAAYVEEGELYWAGETLRSGYDATGDEMLKDVVLWGPMNGAEIAIWCWSDDTMIAMIDQEYHFTDKGIKGYRNIGGYSQSTTYYYDSDGHLEHTALTEDFETFLFGADMAILDPYDGYDFQGNPNVWFDYICDEKGRIISASSTYDGVNFLVTLEYDNGGNIEAFIYSENYGEKLKISHDEYGRVCRLEMPDLAGDPSVEFKYNSDGSYTMCSDSEYDEDIEFDNKGRFVGVGNGYENYRAEYNERGRISQFSYESDDGFSVYSYKSYKYLEDGSIDRIELSDNGIISLSVQCSYDNEGRLVQIDYGGEEYDGTYRDIEYDERGNISKMIQHSGDGNLTWASEYSYSENGLLDQMVLTEIDKVRTYTYSYNKYGALVDYDYKDGYR